jgi:hypothetical protein
MAVRGLARAKRRACLASLLALVACSSLKNAGKSWYIYPDVDWVRVGPAVQVKRIGWKDGSLPHYWMRIWNLEDYDEADPEEDHAYTIFEEVGECGAMSSATIQTTSYRPNGSVDESSGSLLPLEWVRLPPDSIGEVVLKFVCAGLVYK